MGIFSSTKAASVEVDDLQRHAPAHAAATAARNGDVPGVAEILAGTRGQSRALVTEAIARNLEHRDAVSWTADEPESADAWLARGAVEIHLGGEARGHGMAETLSTSQVLDFQQLMSDGNRAVERAASLDASDGEPFARMIVACYARGAGRLRELLDELRRRDPDHVWGQMTVVDLLGEKWYGGAGEARSLAESLADEAPEGSLLPVLVPHAIREQWLYQTAFKKNRDAAVGLMLADETRTAVFSALARSVESPAHREQPFTPLVRNVFAMTLSLAGKRKEAADQLAKTGELMTEYPWGILGGVDAWKKARKG